MDNSVRIDKIIEDLKQKINYIDPRVNDKTSLTNEQQQIKNFLDERRIHYLVHFTDAKNIPSIRENGILSVNELGNRSIEYKSNDEYRHDEALDHISLSVSGMNKYLYRAFKNINQTIEHGVAVVINAEMLYKELGTHRFYCNTNAATTEASKGETLDDFEAMFADVVSYTTKSSEEPRKIDRQIEKRASYEPTDIQAEILWNKCVPTEYILCYWDLEEDFFYGN